MSYLNARVVDQRQNSPQLESHTHSNIRTLKHSQLPLALTASELQIQTYATVQPDIQCINLENMIA